MYSAAAASSKGRAAHTAARESRSASRRVVTCRHVNEKSVRFILDLLIYFLLFHCHLSFFPSNFYKASPPLCCTVFSCVSITLHICLGDILIRMNLSSYSPSQTVTTTAIQTTTKRNGLRRFVILFPDLRKLFCHNAF